MRLQELNDSYDHPGGWMSWLMAKLYDPFMARTEDACLAAWRTELLGRAHGRVLELGAGTGVNLEYYPSDAELVLVEPDQHMREALEARLAACELRGEVVPETLEEAQVSGFFDVVVATLVLCSVPEPKRTLARLFEILKPGGDLIFLEHVAASDNPGRLKWQRRIDPVWRHIGDGCRLCRNTGEAIEEAGFEVIEIRRESMRKALPFLRPTIRGIARKPEA